MKRLALHIKPREQRTPRPSSIPISTPGLIDSIDNLIRANHNERDAREKQAEMLTELLRLREQEIRTLREQIVDLRSKAYQVMEARMEYTLKLGPEIDPSALVGRQVTCTFPETTVTLGAVGGIRGTINGVTTVLVGHPKGADGVVVLKQGKDGLLHSPGWVAPGE